MQLEALIFDVDGTLADTEEVHRRAFNETFAAFGVPWKWEMDRYRALLRTTGGKERMRAHANSVGAAVEDALIRRMHEYKTARYTSLIEGGAVALRPGVRDMIDDARRGGLRLAIATTTNRPNVNALIRATFGQEADTMFDAIAAGDEVSRKKPAPDVYLLALARLGKAANVSLAVEDSVNGLLAATAAGIPVVVSPGPYTAHETFEGAAAHVRCFSEIASLPALRDIHARALRGPASSMIEAAE